MSDRKEYLYRIRPVRVEMLIQATPEEDLAVEAHFEYLKELVRRGVVNLAGRTLVSGSDSFGIVLFTAADDETADKIMRSDPAVLAGVMAAELFPFRTALKR